MRLALCMEYPLHQRGGVEALLRALIEGLHERFELFLVTPDDAGALSAGPHGPMLRGHHPWNPKDHSAESCDRLIAWARNNRIDLFHFHLGGTYTWNARSWNRCPITRLAKAGFRCISTNHAASGFWLFVGEQRPLAYRLAALAVCWPAKLRQLMAVECEIAVSKNNHDAVRQWFFPLKSRFRQIYHSTLDGGSAPSPTPPDGRIILSLATVAFLKGQHILAEAFAEIATGFPEWHLHLVGYHAEQACVERIRHIAEKHQLTDRIHLPGATDDPQSAIANAAIYVQPSLHEGLGLSLQEAMFHGRPCIGSKVGGIPELITDATSGLLVPPGDPTALAQALASLITDENRRIRLGHAARKDILAKKMTRQDMIQAHLEIYTR